jgi:ankyrin repeat protein
MTTAVVLVAALMVTGCSSNRTIWEAARNGNMKTVKKLIEQDPSLVDKPHVDAIEMDKGNKWTPLRYAVEERQYKIAQYLIDHGADPLKAAGSNYTPYHASREDRRMERMLGDAIRKSGRPLP